MKNLIAIAVLLFGCQTYDGLYIDDSCSDREIELVETAVEKLNTAVGEEVVYINGVVNGGEDDREGYGTNSRDVVFCFTNDTKDRYLLGYNGRIENDDILLKAHSDDSHFLRTIMHELGHHVFGAWHISDKTSIMYRYNNGVIDYTAADLREFGY